MGNSLNRTASTVLTVLSPRLGCHRECVYMHGDMYVHVCACEMLSFGGLLKQIVGVPPTVSDSVGSGQGPRICISNNILLVLLVREPHLEYEIAEASSPTPETPGGQGLVDTLGAVLCTDGRLEHLKVRIFIKHLTITA